jgi:L-threonylcarbamoyladenylate synthase
MPEQKPENAQPVPEKDTQIFDLNAEDVKQAMAVCGKIIQDGGTVVFPTETVYGLGANALSTDAVAQIYAAKGRPGDNPLIVHIYDTAQLKDLVAEVPDKAKKLADAYWPGPLTMIMKRSDKIPDSVTAGLDTVGIRFPSHPMAHAFLEASDRPVAAPSANISGRPSPTKGQHVLEDMLGKVDAILIADESDVGLESTVIDMTTEPPTVYRPGGITVEDIKAVIGEVAVSPGAVKPVELKEVRSPGMKYRHYAPKGKMVIARGSLDEMADKINEGIRKLHPDQKGAILATDETLDRYHKGIILSLGSRKDPSEMSHKLFDCLRAFDDLGATDIFAEDIPVTNDTLALINRLYKAAGYTFI